MTVVKRENENPINVLKSIRLTGKDRDILKILEPVVDGIAEIFGSSCEVILHSFEDPGHSVFRIANSHITGRKVGSPITDLGLNVLLKSFETKQDIVGSYFTRTDDGKIFKSITILIRNSRNAPIGMLCINIDLSTDFLGFVSEFTPPNTESSQTVETFPTEIPDLIQRSISQILKEINQKTGVSPTEKNREIIYELSRKGIFDIKGAVDIVATQMGVSKFTIYHYIRELKAR